MRKSENKNGINQTKSEKVCLNNPMDYVNKSSDRTKSPKSIKTNDNLIFFPKNDEKSNYLPRYKIYIDLKMMDRHIRMSSA